MHQKRIYSALFHLDIETTTDPNNILNWKHKPNYINSTEYKVFTTKSNLQNFWQAWYSEISTTLQLISFYNKYESGLSYIAINNRTWPIFRKHLQRHIFYCSCLFSYRLMWWDSSVVQHLGTYFDEIMDCLGFNEFVCQSSKMITGPVSI